MEVFVSSVLCYPELSALTELQMSSPSEEAEGER